MVDVYGATIANLVQVNWTESRKSFLGVSYSHVGLMEFKVKHTNTYTRTRMRITASWFVYSRSHIHESAFTTYASCVFLCMRVCMCALGFLALLDSHLESCCHLWSFFHVFGDLHVWLFAAVVRAGS